MTQIGFQKLILPALRGRIGDWTYYLTLLKMRDVSTRVSVAQDIHESATLNDLIQRVLQEGHSDNIKQYLLTHEQRFFNSLVLGVYGGAPQWLELDIRDSYHLNTDDLPNYIERSLGLLVLNGTETLFAIDGQHRVVGIKKAVDSNASIGNEDVAAIFVAHKNDPIGMERTRRLFTTLNRYAKAVGFGELVALDEDDVVAIVTRRLIEHHPLFIGKIYTSAQKNIPPTDRQNLTSVSALYEAVDLILQKGKPKQWANFKKIRPRDDLLDQFYIAAVDYWNQMIETFSELRQMRDSNPSDHVAAQFRNEGGGHLLFRPVGLVIITKVVRQLIDKESLDLKTAIERVSHAKLWLSESPWAGLLWDSTNMTMMVTGERQGAAIKLLYYSCGGNLVNLSQRNSPEKLQKQLAGLLNRDISEVIIPRYYSPDKELL